MDVLRDVLLKQPFSGLRHGVVRVFPSPSMEMGKRVHQLTHKQTQERRWLLAEESRIVNAEPLHYRLRLENQCNSVQPAVLPCSAMTADHLPKTPNSSLTCHAARPQLHRPAQPLPHPFHVALLPHKVRVGSKKLRQSVARGIFDLGSKSALCEVTVLLPRTSS